MEWDLGRLRLSDAKRLIRGSRHAGAGRERQTFA
jgi:hypothetical protein